MQGKIYRPWIFSGSCDSIRQFTWEYRQTGGLFKAVSPGRSR